MTHRDPQDHLGRLRLAVHGRRTRVIVAMAGLLLALGGPAAILGTAVPTVDAHTVRPPDNPGGLGVTGALPGDPLPTDTTPAAGTPTATPSGPDTSFGAGQSGIPTPPNLLDGPLGIPGAVLDAYKFAQRTLAQTQPGCHLSWSILAGIGRIESGHASDGRVDAYGNTLGPILGPRLDGSPGMAAIPDTDHGQLDGDPVWDRAVGPMQFIPSSWRAYGVDGNGDGVANPNNIYDATIATGRYLCAGGTDLSVPVQQQAAVFRYNHSATYVAIVLGWAHAYLTGVIPIQSGPGPVPRGINGNGGVPIGPDVAALAAARPAAVAELVPMAATASATTSSPTPPPPTTAAASPVTASPPVATPAPTTSPVSTTVPATTTAPTTTEPPGTTAPGVATTSPPPPPTTTTPTEPTPSPPPPLPTTEAPLPSAPPVGRE
ncbi:MAG: lytic murein transglycosylase [Pseudonocardiaceae bacterium]